MVELTLEQLIAKAPAIATQEASPSVSGIYTHIPSTKVIEDVQSLGWTPVNAVQRKNRVGHNKEFAQHRVEFRIDNPISISNSADVIFPQVTFINSHDGKSTFRFYAGLFRLVCENGLVVPVKLNGESLGEGFRIRHKYYNIDELNETFTKIISEIKESMKPVFKMNETKLDSDKINHLAKKGLAIREGVDRNQMNKFMATITTQTLDSILTPKRQMDSGNNAWRVFNTIQESLIGGDYEMYSMNEQGVMVSRKARPLNDMVKIQRINTELFKEAELILN